MTDAEVVQLISQATDFPKLSEAAAEIANLTSDLSAPVKDVASRIKSVPDLEKKMLKVVNSGFYELTDRITGIEDAIQLLGYKKMCNLAVGIDLMSNFPTKFGEPFDHAKFWEKSICYGVASAEIAQRLPNELAADVFTIGLIQDLGILFLVQFRPLEYGAAMGSAKAEGIHLVNAEQETIGVDHAKIGALLCRKWKLPKLLGDAVLSHHFYENKKTPSAGIKSILQVINLSSLLVSVMYDDDGEDKKPDLIARAKEFVGFGPKVIEELLSSILEPAALVGEAFSLKVDPHGEVPEKKKKPDEPIECPKCSHSNPPKTKFCGNCGSSLIAEEAPPPSESNKILVAEDSIASRRALCFVVKKLGYVPVEATNGYEAVDMAEKDPPGMVLMDIMMPAMNGIEALKKIRDDKAIAHIPIVMLTSLTDNESVIEAIQEGANDYIVKPYTIETISERVDKFMPKQKKKKRSRRSKRT